MDIEKTYQLMNRLEMFKRFLKDINYLKITKSDRGDFVSVFARFVDQLEERDEFVAELKKLLTPVFENKIKELEEEIEK